MLASNGAFLLTDKPTRIFGETRTRIDHIITNDTCNVIYLCVFLGDISDHFPVACLVAHNSCSKKGRGKGSTGAPAGYATFYPGPALAGGVIKMGRG